MPTATVLENMAPVLCELSPDFVYPQLLRGLVGAWSPCLSRDKGARLMDLSGRGNHGTLTNMDPATDWVTTERGMALDFDGVNDTVALQASASQYAGTGPLSVLAWFITSVSGLDVEILRFDGGTTRKISILRVSSTNKLRWYNTDTSFTDDIASAASVNDGVLHCGIGVFGTSTVKLYLDGRQVNSATRSCGDMTPDPLAAWYIGSYAASSSFFPGKILECTIRKVETTDLDAALLYQLGPGGWTARKRTSRSYLVPAPPQTITVSEVCTATATATAPSVTLGALTVTVSDAAAATATAVAPTITLGAVTITVSEVCTATASAVAPSVTLGALTISLSAVIATATATVVAPDVLTPLLPGMEYRVAADRLHYSVKEE